MATIDKVQELLASDPDIAQAEIARRLGISRQAVNQAIQRIREKGTIEVAALEPLEDKKQRKIEQIVCRQLDIVTQLQKANTRAWLFIEKLTPKDKKEGVSNRQAEVIFRGLAEIRGQLEFQAKLILMLHDAQAVKEFQEEVLAVISEVDPFVAKEILRRLAERRALRTAVRIDRTEDREPLQ